jgi:hypothetical protein
MPYTLHAEINRALRVLNYEEFPIDERPPKRIWNDGKALNEHFEQVEAARKAKYGVKDEPDEDDYEYEENAVELVKRG